MGCWWSFSIKLVWDRCMYINRDHIVSHPYPESLGYLACTLRLEVYNRGHKQSGIMFILGISEHPTLYLPGCLFKTSFLTEV